MFAVYETEYFNGCLCDQYFTRSVSTAQTIKTGTFLFKTGYSVLFDFFLNFIFCSNSIFVIT